MLLYRVLLEPIVSLVFASREVFWILSRTLGTLLRGPWRVKETVDHTAQMAFGSLPIVTISTAFAGFVTTGQLAMQMDTALHTVEMLPGFTGQFIFRELGIVIPALLMVSKVGASTTAEVGTMKVTEQIDALRLLQIDPIEYLVVPRFVASIITVSTLTLFSIAVTISCAMGLAIVKYNFSMLEYLNMLARFVDPRDLIGCALKGGTFGAVIPIISCYHGFRCSGGAEGVGNATTNSVVASTILIITLDFVLTFAFSIILY